MKSFSRLVCALVLTVVASSTLQAQRYGALAIWADDVDVGIGGRMELDLKNKLSKTAPASNAFFIGQFDFFLDPCEGGDCTYFEINPGIAIPLNATNFKPYVGGGLNIARMSADAGPFGNVSDTEVGVNLLGGLKLNLSGLDAFTEARISLGGGEQFSISFGLLFGQTGSSSSRRR